MVNGKFKGFGTKSSPFLVEDVADLDAIRNSSDKGYYFEQTADLNLSGINWIPIDNFKGYYDGKHYKISNLTIKYDKERWYNETNNVYHEALTQFGLFGSATRSELRNIILLNVDISFGSGNGTFLAGGAIGGLVGYANNTKIFRCSMEGRVKAHITLSTTNGLTGGYGPGWTISDSGIPSQEKTWMSFTGGGFGSLIGTCSFGDIDECYAISEVSLNATTGTEIGVGGLVGMTMGNNYLDNCYTFSKLFSQNKRMWIDDPYPRYDSMYIAGLVGLDMLDSARERNVYYTNCYSVYTADYNIVRVNGPKNQKYNIPTRIHVGATAMNYPHPKYLYHEGTMDDYKGLHLNPDGSVASTYNSAQPGLLPVGSVVGAYPRSLMMRQSSFVNWDFDNIWRITEGRDYPRLRWQEISDAVLCQSINLPLPIKLITIY